MKKRIPYVLTQDDLNEITRLFSDYQEFRPKKLLGLSSRDTESLDKDAELHRRAQMLSDHLSLSGSREIKPLAPHWWMAVLRKAREADPHFQLPVETIALSSTEFWKGLIDMNNTPPHKEDEKDERDKTIEPSIPLR